MDQSSNDAEKRNWRERLGIGAKEMPKIADEFAKPAEPVLVTPKAKGDPVVVAKPAPMAPRVAAKPVTTAPIAPRQPSLAPAASPKAPSIANTSPDVLAEKLRHQREAAEKLAEQRVHNAKDRPEAQRPLTTQAAPPAAQPQAAPAPRPTVGGSKPKFTFAEDDTRQPEPPSKRDPRAMPPQGRPSASPQARPGQPPQMAPTRPPLGGERIVTPQVPPPSRQAPPPPPVMNKPGFNPQFRPQQSPPAGLPQGYRPIDPATGFTPPPPSFNMPPRQPTTANVVPRPMPAPPAGMAIDPRLQPPPYMADPYAPPLGQRGPVQPTGPRYDQMPPMQQAALRNDQLRPANHSFEGDYSDDIFEDAAPKPVRRASLNDYSQAYHPDQDIDYGAPPRRRSSGPIILLSLLFLAALAGIGGVFYYKKFVSGGSSVTSGEAPVVATPSQPAKVAPQEATPDAATAGGAPAQPTKKQIYDRIVGDKEVLGGNTQVVPSIETPVQPAQGQSTEPAAIPAPDAGADPASAGQGNTGTGDEPLPLPMPPPVQNNGQQGALPVPAQPQQVAAASAPTSGGTVAPTGYSQDQTQQMAAVSQDKTVIVDAPAATAPEKAVADTATEPVQAKPVVKAKPKAVAAQPKKKAVVAKNLGSKPVVLVPDQNGNGVDAATQDPAVTVDGEPPLQVTPAPVEQPVKKKKTLLGMFTGENKQIDQQNASGDTIQQAPVTTPAVKPKQVASVEPPAAQPLPKARAVSGNRYVLQLASYSTQAEAQQAYSKMANNSAVSSLQPTITPVSIGGSTRYRLTLGPVATSEQAANACAKLAGVGQPDCVVKREGN